MRGEKMNGFGWFIGLLAGWLLAWLGRGNTWLIFFLIVV